MHAPQHVASQETTGHATTDSAVSAPDNLMRTQHCPMLAAPDAGSLGGHSLEQRWHANGGPPKEDLYLLASRSPTLASTCCCQDTCCGNGSARSFWLGWVHCK